MASILGRFKDIMSANINSLLDKMENPEKMIDQYVRNMERDLNSVKSETAAVMAQESAAKRKVVECEDEIKKMDTYARKALKSGNESDAKLFLEKKATLQTKLESLNNDKEVATQNALKMREMHDKLASDIQALSAKRSEIKAKMKMAKTSERISSLSGAGPNGNVSAFNAMEEKANRMIDEANAKMELNMPKSDGIDDLMKKYDDNSSETSSAVDDELEKMKKEMGLE
ncbi:PspA/IM30 family protein [Leptotrichia buccalis]